MYYSYRMFVCLLVNQKPTVHPVQVRRIFRLSVKPDNTRYMSQKSIDRIVVLSVGKYAVQNFYESHTQTWAIGNLKK